MRGEKVSEAADQCILPAHTLHRCQSSMPHCDYTFRYGTVRAHKSGTVLGSLDKSEFLGLPRQAGGCATTSGLYSANIFTTYRRACEERESCTAAPIRRILNSRRQWKLRFLEAMVIKFREVWHVHKLEEIPRHVNKLMVSRCVRHSVLVSLHEQTICGVHRLRVQR